MARPAWFTNRLKRSGGARKPFPRTIIAPSAIRTFLERPRDDFDWIKGVAPWRLRKYVLDRYNAFRTRPRRAQLACFAIGMEHPEFLFNLDCGVGKSKACLDLVRYHRFNSAAHRWLVLVPNVVNIQAWEDQLAAHAPDLTYEKLIGTRSQRHALVNERADVHLLNYAGLRSYMTQLKPGDSEKAGFAAINQTAAQKFADLWDGVIFDEIHNVGNKDSLTYWLCKRLSKAATFKYGSTATLFGKDPTMMWSQFDLVDGGYTLGETLGLYRAAFFREVDNPWGRIEYEFDRSKMDLLSEFMRHRSLRFTAAESGDVPKVSYIRERLTWTDEQLLYYNRVRSECRIAGIGKVKLNPHAYTRMRQITSGYVGYESDNGKAQLEFERNPKLERLLQVIREMPWDTKIMVFHQYIYTGRMIAEALAKRKIKFTELWGGVKDPAAQYRRFIKDPEYRVQITQYNMAAGGNPHEVASYVYYFECPPDPITRKQSVERVVRPGQPKHVFVYDPAMPNSVDEDTLDALDAGQDFYELVCSGKGIARTDERPRGTPVTAGGGGLRLVHR